MISKISLLLSICLCISISTAYDFCKENKDVLQKYNFFEDFGGKDPSKKLSIDNLPFLKYKKKTADTTIDQYWLLNMCGNEVDVSNNKLDFSKYQANSILYGISKLESGSVYTDIINVMKSDMDANKMTLSEVDDEYTGLKIFIDNVNSNSFNISFQCDSSLKQDKFEKIEKKESFDASSEESPCMWTMQLKGPGGCFANGKDNKPVQGTSSKHSFFYYFFVYVILFTLVYIGASSYLEVKDGGTLQDFEDVFKYKFKELMFSIPAFTRELYNKIIGNNFTRYTPTNNDSSNHNSRDGYAAV